MGMPLVPADNPAGKHQKNPSAIWCFLREELDVQGRSNALDLGLRYPLLRSSASNIYVSLNGEQRDLRDEVRSTGTVTDKSAKVLNLSLNGDWRDNLGGGGVTLASLTVTRGKLNIDSADAAELDAVAAKTAGSYSKWGWSLERQQAVARGVTFSASVRGQNANKNLDSSEKFSLGGTLIDASQRQPITVTRRGRPVAVVLSYEDCMQRSKTIPFEVARVVSESYPLRGHEAAASVKAYLAGMSNRAAEEGLTEEDLTRMLNEE